MKKIVITEIQLKKLSESITNEQTAYPSGGMPRLPEREKVQNENLGFVLIWGFPEYAPSYEKGDKISDFISLHTKLIFGGKKENTYGNAGHGGVIIVEPDGNSICYEFGPYEEKMINGKKEKYGKVEVYPLGKIGKWTNSQPKKYYLNKFEYYDVQVTKQLSNLYEIAKIGQSKTRGDGPKLRMIVAGFYIPNVQNAKKEATRKRDYFVADIAGGGAKSNCITFGVDVAVAGGLKRLNNKWCIPSPEKVVRNLQRDADVKFDVT